MSDEVHETVAGLIKDSLRMLTATAALLVTISSAIAPFTISRAGFPTYLVFYSAISYLGAIIAGIVAHGALTSAVYYGDDPFVSNWVRIPAIIQWFAFVSGSAITVYMLFLLTLS